MVEYPSYCAFVGGRFLHLLSLGSWSSEISLIFQSGEIFLWFTLAFVVCEKTFECSRFSQAS